MPVKPEYESTIKSLKPLFLEMLAKVDRENHNPALNETQTAFLRGRASVLYELSHLEEIEAMTKKAFEENQRLAKERKDATRR